MEKTHKFLVIYHDLDYSIPFTNEQIKELTKAHVDNIKDLDSKGYLYFCGFLKGEEKAMLILNAKTYGEAENYILKDPFIINKIYK